jgi:hypothetical protein
MSVTAYGDLYDITIGDDDGFGSGTPMVAGDDIWSMGPDDGDGTDRWVVGASENLSYIFTYNELAHVTHASLFIQYADWPESYGDLWLDGVKVNYKFTKLYPWQQVAPWTVLNSTINLNSYEYLLKDGYAKFEFIGTQTDYYAIDFLTLTVVPVPGAFILGCMGLGMAGLKMRKRKEL